MNLDDLKYSDEYAQYIMNNCSGERVICNGDTLLEAMEQGYLFDEFLRSNMAQLDENSRYLLSKEFERSVNEHFCDGLVGE